MESQYQTQPCANGCGNRCGKSRHGLCVDCANTARRERWREKNPTFKEMVEMDDEKLEAALNRLFVARTENRGRVG